MQQDDVRKVNKQYFKFYLYEDFSNTDELFKRLFKD